MDPEIKALVTILLESENRLTQRMIDLTATVDHAATTVERLATTVGDFVKASEEHVKASNERIILIEKQLDAFLRAIRPKPNGKEGEQS